MKSVILISILLFFYSRLSFGQFEYEHFQIDSLSSDYIVTWKKHDSSRKADGFVILNGKMRQLLSPIQDSIFHMLSKKIPESTSPKTFVRVGIIYSESGDVVRIFYLVNKETLHYIPETLLLDISYLLLGLHIDYPILEYIEEFWQRQSSERRKRPTGYTMVYFSLY